MKITIIEALAEIKTIEKRLAKKRSAINDVILRQENFKDPLEKQGGSVQFIKDERQSINSLHNNILSLRLSINKANLENTITIGQLTMSIAEWLIWRREVAPHYKEMLLGMTNEIKRAHTAASRQGAQVVALGDEAKSDKDIIVNVDEKELYENVEQFEDLLGKLDGQLALKNATITIEYNG